MMILCLRKKLRQAIAPGDQVHEARPISGEYQIKPERKGGHFFSLVGYGFAVIWSETASYGLNTADVALKLLLAPIDHYIVQLDLPRMSAPIGKLMPHRSYALCQQPVLSFRACTDPGRAPSRLHALRPFATLPLCAILRAELPDATKTPPPLESRNQNSPSGNRLGTKDGPRFDEIYFVSMVACIN